MLCLIVPNQLQHITDWRFGESTFPDFQLRAPGALANVVPSPLTKFELVFHFSIWASSSDSEGLCLLLNGVRHYASDRFGQRCTKCVSRSFISAEVSGCHQGS